MYVIFIYSIGFFSTAYRSHQFNMSTSNDNPENEIMCSCSGTTRSKIYDLYKQGLDIDGISQRTGIKTGCGGCEWDIEAFVNALKEVDSAS